MTESIQAKRERRNALAKETRNLLDTNTGAEWGEEQQKVYDANLEEIERIDAEISREQRLMDVEAEKEFSQLGVREREELEETPVRSLFNTWLRRGDNALSAEDWRTIRNTMSTTTDSEGGYTVPEEWATAVREALKAYGGMRQVSTILTTASGERINYPTSDGTEEDGEIVAENTAAAEEDPDFGTKPLDTYKFGSKVITVPIELLQDSAVDIEAFVRRRIEMRLGRITNRMYTAGTGTDQPVGIVTAAPVGREGAVSATPEITYQDILELQHSVDPAYRDLGRARWMLHDDAVKLIRLLKDDNNRPLFLPSYDAGIRGGVPAELAGYPITINQQLDEPDVEATSMLFGDFTYYIIRDAMAMTLFRFTDSAYSKKGQVGFLAWMRSGGNFVDVGGAVKKFVHGAAS